jgi:hypothetical protein
MYLGFEAQQEPLSWVSGAGLGTKPSICPSADGRYHLHFLDLFTDMGELD